MTKARILVIEVESVPEKVLIEELRRKGHEVLFARGGAEGLHAFGKDRPEIVMTDVSNGGSRGFEVLRQIKNLDPEARIVVLTEEIRQGQPVGGLRGYTVNYLKKPVTPWELSEVIDKLVGIASAETNTRFVLKESKRIVMDNRIDKIWGVVNQLLICAENVCEKAEIQELALGLYEIIINAIEHGSLEITFEEKRQAIEANTYEGLLKDRLSNPVYSRRRVTIDYRMVPGELHFVIRDEGKGFNWRTLPCSDPLSNLFNPCGRGIFLARIYLDRVEFNEKGNEVHLVKCGYKNGGNDGSPAEH